MSRRDRSNEYVVIGLGRFGSSLARDLTKRGASVLGIDRDPELVQRYSEEITETVALDSTDESALGEVDVFSYKTVVVAIGDNFEASLITTSILKQRNVTQVIAKAMTERQKDILTRMGADRVILPEHEAGEALSHKLLHPGVIEYFELGSDFTISEVTAPESWVGKTLSELNLRATCGVTIVVLKRGDSINPVPHPGFPIEKGDLLVVCGTNKSIDKMLLANR